MKTWAPQIYQERRQRLCEQVGSGLILLPGNGDSPANFKANCYPFRQDSTFSTSSVWIAPILWDC